MKIWDSDDEGDNQSSNKNVSKRAKQKSEFSSERPKILKRKDQKLIKQIQDIARTLKNSIENKLFQEIGEAYDSLVKLHPQIEKVFQGNKEPPKLYGKCLYLIEEATNSISNEEKKKISNKNALTKLKKAIQNQSEEIKLIVEDYKEDKDPDDELEIDEAVSDISDNEDKQSEGKSADEKEDIVDEPSTRRLKWVKAEYKQGEVVQKKKAEEKKEDQVEDAGLHPQVTKKDIMAEKILGRIEEENLKQLTDKDIEAEYIEKMSQVGQYKPMETIERVETLLSITNNKTLKIKLFNLVILCCFDYSQGQLHALSLSTWRKIYLSIEKILSNYIEILNDRDFDPSSESFLEVQSIVKSNIVSFLEKLQSELYKALQFTDQLSNVSRFT